MPPEGQVIDVQPINAVRTESDSSALGDNRKLYATVAYYYPQYRLEEVERMPYRDVYLLLKVAKQIEAEQMYNLTMIASAPQSKNGKGVKTLLDHFKKILKD